jgi:FixJ family two-component response regulator
MPKIYGMDAISYFQTKYSSLHLIVMAGREDVQLAISLLKKGVKDTL